MTTEYAKDQPEGFTNRIERVAIVGAGGQVGKHIAEELVKTGKHTVTAVTRIGSKSKLPSGVKAAEVNYDDEQTIIDALKSQKFLVISLAADVPEDTHEKLATAAAKAGVPWIMPNVWGGDIANRTLLTENLTGSRVYANIESVEKAGVSWVAMACSFWYEYSLAMGAAFYGFDFQSKKATFFDDGKARINMSTWRQCGRAAAQLLSLKELPEDENDKSPTLSQWRNKPLYVSSFLVSQRDMLDSVQRVTGTTDEDWQIEHEESEPRYKRGLGMLQTGDLGGFAMALYTRTFYPNGDGDFESKHGLANEALGLPKEDFDEATKRALDMVASGWNPWANRG